MTIIDNTKLSNDQGTSIPEPVIQEEELEVEEHQDVEDAFYDESYEEEVKVKDLIQISPSSFVEFAVRVPDKITQTRIPFSFSSRRYLKLPYDTSSKRILLKSGRQTEKSSMLGNKSIAYACINSSMSILYVSPTNQQTKTFSQDRIKETIDTSEILRNWTTSKLNDSVFTKQFVNRSKISLRYAYHNADRVRGVSADVILLDEIQDIITDNIPVIEECASHSPFKIFSYSGTPKSTDNPIEKFWSDYSTQNEWVVPCEHHTPWHWNILGEANIGKDFLMCDKCEKQIYANHPKSQWAMMNGSIMQSSKIKEPFEGFRVPQLMVPWIDWQNITHKYNTLPRATFMNEVLGLSFDSGLRPLTKNDVIELCDPNLKMDKETLSEIKRNVGGASPVFAGIDWGCHDEETRILTEGKGFIHFRDLTYADKVAQWCDKTREMTFIHPLNITIKEHTGSLLKFKAKSVDMLLTKDHRMKFKAIYRESDIKTDSAEHVSKLSGVRFIGSIDWKGNEVRSFTLSGLPVSSGYSGCSDREIPMDNWLEFLGNYLSEGGLCFNGNRPSCIKFSQRETVNPINAKQMRSNLRLVAGNQLTEFPNPKTGDVNWTIYGKQFWKWMLDNVGSKGYLKRIPRYFLSLSKRQLTILFKAMMNGDGSYDKRQGKFNGCYSSTSKGLCEDFQELCIKLGLRASVRKAAEAKGDKREKWVVSWSAGNDHNFSSYRTPVEEVPYTGKVYCCSVPDGNIVTERHGKIAFQGNSGENSYTVINLGAYINNRYTVFYWHRFEGAETEPEEQISLIMKMIDYWNVSLVGVDYGGGFYMNDKLERRYGKERIVKFQYTNPSVKVKWDRDMQRFLVHRTEVMSDIFNAMKRKDVFRFPNFEQFQEPFGNDMLNIFSEYNEQQRSVQYKKAPDCTDDSFHSLLFGFMASMLKVPRFDIMNPTQKTQGLSEG